MAALWKHIPPGIKSIMDNISEDLDALHTISEKQCLLEKRGEDSDQRFQCLENDVVKPVIDHDSQNVYFLNVSL